MKQTTGQAMERGIDRGTGRDVGRHIARATALLALLWHATGIWAAGTFFVPIPLPDCGKELAVQLDPREPRNAEYLGDLHMYREDEGKRIADAIAAVCRGNARQRALLAQRVDRIYIHYATGQYDVTPYLLGRILIVETPHDEPFNATVFKRNLVRALRTGLRN